MRLSCRLRYQYRSLPFISKRVIMKRTFESIVAENQNRAPNVVIPPSLGQTPLFKAEPLPVNDPTLDVVHIKNFISKEEQDSLWNEIIEQLGWNRVCYTSNRFGLECETPCWSNCYGGFPEFSPYQPMPAVLLPIQKRLESLLNTKFNIVLTRLYLTGDDNIAWHTDGREFLGKETNVASISLGAARKFEMKRPKELWPEVNKGAPRPASIKKDANGKEKEAIFTWNLESGDMFCMRGKTQQFWHHRVPQEKTKKGPQYARININFRTYYKYTVHGDTPFDPKTAKKYAQIVDEWNKKDLEEKKKKGTSTITDFFKASK